MALIRQPVFRIEYEGEDITSFSGGSSHLISVDYHDNLDQTSDEVTVVLSDTARDWLGGLYPELGQVFTLVFGYEGEDLTEVLFEIDEVSSNFLDTFTIRGSGTPVTSQLRTRNWRAWEETTLREVFEEVSHENKLKLVGDIKEIEYERLTQEGERDIDFLAKEAEKHDHLIKIDQVGSLVIYSHADLDAAAPVFTLAREDILTSPPPRYRDKVADIYSVCRVRCDNPDSDESLDYLVTAEGLHGTGETFDITEQGIETEQQAEDLGISAIRKKNEDKITLTLTTPGSTRYQAGLNFEIEGPGATEGVVDSQKYQITRATHRVGRSGYLTQIQARVVLDLGEISVNRGVSGGISQ